MFDRHGFLPNAYPGKSGKKVSDETTQVGYFDSEVQGYERMLMNFPFQIHPKRLDILSLPGPMDMIRLSA